eukprot:TCALIF_03552-PA protein Name:"Similar to CPT2 Carnitine O-palmitoyltransferase 2, mitochondrial (Bos taurus)" AED:0.02 eAED:0.02 QI:0/1/0/1/1/1/2/0/639
MPFGPKGSLETKSREYQYLQQSIVSTDKFQKSLPHLPIPKLHDTCDRYLASQRPLLDQADFNQTEKLVKQFIQGPGQTLDAELRRQDKSNKHTSYICEPWTDMYLRDRRPVSFVHNPGIMFAHDTRPEFMNPAWRSAHLLISTLRLLKSYQANILKPEVFHLQPAKTNTPTYWNRVKFMPNLIATPLSYLFKAFPLDMSQYNNLLQSTRIPLPNRDVIQRYPDSKHVVVLRRGHFYHFDVLDQDGNLFEPHYYLKSIQYILEHEPKGESSAIGVFTSESRDLWSEMRSYLVDELGNEAALEQIDSGLHVICLDEWDHADEEAPKSTREIVGGSNPANRWFDKSFSLIYSRNGSVSINFEHAWGDGVAVMRLIDEIVQDSQENNFFSAKESSNPTISVKEIKINVDARIKNQIDQSKKSHFDRYNSVDFEEFYFYGLGKDDCKRLQVGPDSLMQTAFQIAYHRLFGKFVPTYESCSTAIFKHGRTETVRPCTHDTKTCAEAFNNSQPGDPKELLGLLQKCSKTHFEMTKNAAQGKGWDRHLFAIKDLCHRQGHPIPELFEDPAYSRINQNVLSTSTLASINMIHGGFCPVVPDGFGLGYQIRNDFLGVGLSAFNAHSNAKDMNDALISSFEDLKKVLKAN